MDNIIGHDEALKDWRSVSPHIGCCPHLAVGCSHTTTFDSIVERRRTLSADVDYLPIRLVAF